MEPPQDPIEGQEPSPDWTGFALNVGLRLAETFGLGLTLFNALRARFEGVAASILGDIASTIGAAVRTATGLSTEELNRALPMGDLPTVPASWHQGEPGDRVIAGVDITSTDAGGAPVDVRRVWVNGLETLTPQDFIDEANALYIEAMNTTDPRLVANIAGQISNLIFLAKRY